MTLEEATYVLGCLFGMYCLGWSTGYIIYVFKASMEKI